MICKVLVVDDEQTLAQNIQRYLARHGYEVRCAGTGAEAMDVLRSFAPAVVLLDLHLPDADGIGLVPSIKAMAPAAGIIIMTGYASFPTAVLAIKVGADDYVAKPVVLSELRKLIYQVRCVPVADAAGRELGRTGLAAILGDAPAIVELREQIRRLLALERQSGNTASVVLVIGETGSGKELVARALHLESLRASAPFIELNCTMLPEQLVEDRLFGHERGAFTDARESRAGLFEAADGGTLFLDEIGDLAIAVQAKLLKFLEDRRVRRLGGIQERTVDLRVVAATHQPLEQLVRAGQFRADLYFRLRVVELQVAPLRERPEDVVPLAQTFLKESALRWRRPKLELAPAATAVLEAHTWPGNVRELKNVIEQAVVLSTTQRIEPEQLALSRLGEQMAVSEDPNFRLPDEGMQIGDLERDLLHQALVRSIWNVSAAARLLGLSRDTVRYRMQKYGLLRPS